MARLSRRTLFGTGTAAAVAVAPLSTPATASASSADAGLLHAVAEAARLNLLTISTMKAVRPCSEEEEDRIFRGGCSRPIRRSKLTWTRSSPRRAGQWRVCGPRPRRWSSGCQAAPWTSAGKSIWTSNCLPRCSATWWGGREHGEAV